MKKSIRNVIATSLLLMVPLAEAQQSQERDAKFGYQEGAGIDFNYRGGFDLDLDNVNKDDIYVRDLLLEADMQLASWVKARLNAEINDQIGDIDRDTFDAENWIKDAYVGFKVSPGGQTVVTLIGQQSIKVGGNTTELAINKNNPNHALSEQLERQMAVVIEISPKISGSKATTRFLSELLQQIDVSFSNADSTGDLDLGQLEDINAYAVRIKGAIDRVQTNFAYYRAEHEGSSSDETRMSVGAKVIVGPEVAVYGEYLKMENNPLSPDINSVTTLGAGKSLWGGRGALEYHNIDSADPEAKDKMAASYKRPINRNLDWSAQLEVPMDSDATGEDAKAYASLDFHKKRRSPESPLFKNLIEQQKRKQKMMDDRIH